MPYSVSVNKPKKTITLICWGNVTIDEMMDYERRYWGGPEHEGYHHIIDLQVAKLKIDLNEGLMLITHATPVDPDSYIGARSAIVVSDRETEALGDAYRDARHAVCSPKIREIRVFYDMQEAKAWIGASEVVFSSQA